MFEIRVSEAVETMDIFGRPFDVAKKLVPTMLPPTPSRDGALVASVGEMVNIADNLGTYKRWFNGAKFFYTVKPLPPTRE